MRQALSHENIKATIPSSEKVSVHGCETRPSNASLSLRLAPPLPITIYVRSVMRYRYERAPSTF